MSVEKNKRHGPAGLVARVTLHAGYDALCTLLAPADLLAQWHESGTRTIDWDAYRARVVADVVHRRLTQMPWWHLS